MDITLRHETPADVGAIATLTAAAFLHAEHSSHTEQFIVNALRALSPCRWSRSTMAHRSGTRPSRRSYSATAPPVGTGWHRCRCCRPVRTGDRQPADPPAIGRTAGTARRRLRGAGRSELLRPFRLPAQTALTLPGVPQDYFRAIAFRGALPCAEVAFHNAFNAEA